MITTEPRISLPETVQRDMDRYRRQGAWSVPVSYIEFHRDLAERALAEGASRYGFVVLGSEMVDAGWLDGMRELRALIRTRSGEYRVIQWHDGNQGFMIHMPSGVQGILSEKELA